MPAISKRRIKAKATFTFLHQRLIFFKPMTFSIATQNSTKWSFRFSSFNHISVNEGGELFHKECFSWWSLNFQKISWLVLECHFLVFWPLQYESFVTLKPFHSSWNLLETDSQTESPGRGCGQTQERMQSPDHTVHCSTYLRRLYLKHRENVVIIQN